MTWSAFQVITSFTNHPWYYNLSISMLVQGCIFHAVTGRHKILLHLCSIACVASHVRYLLSSCDFYAFSRNYTIGTWRFANFLSLSNRVTSRTLPTIFSDRQNSDSFAQAPVKELLPEVNQPLLSCSSKKDEGRLHRMHIFCFLAVGVAIALATTRGAIT